MIKLEKPPVDPELKQRIQELISQKGGGGYNADLVEDIIETSLKILHDVEDRGDVRVISTALRELRYAFKLFAPYSTKRKVTIFGSARTQPSRMEYQHAVEFGKKIVEAGYMVITGAGPGIMQRRGVPDALRDTRRGIRYGEEARALGCEADLRRGDGRGYRIGSWPGPGKRVGLPLETMNS